MKRTRIEGFVAVIDLVDRLEGVTPIPDFFPYKAISEGSSTNNQNLSFMSLYRDIPDLMACFRSTLIAFDTGIFGVAGLIHWFAIWSRL